MLLMIENLLLILAAAVQDHRIAAVEGHKYSLDMALNSVDDQYYDCTPTMGRLVEEEYLEKEINNSPDFKKAWEEGKEKYKTPENTLTLNNLIAIHVYTNIDLQVYKKLNNDVRKGKDDYKQKKYNWYSLHFLLTNAIQKLKNKHKTFRGTNMDFDMVDKKTEVRFGSFTSSSLDREVAQGFGNKSCFEIETAEGADVTKYSKHPEQKEVLIPPYEKFIVTDVKTRKDTEGLWCETVFFLESSGSRSDLNCVLIQDRAKL
ncbi:ecto-ADP-ribosyltransferase 5-like [Onychostoma macrolepis]|uniref:ecto-ADP-ribosyltransferase 5-like n=1 Tax=Onychostoma macrolepis TaxID=369639 RepID=UPI00272CE3BF|nr:ecto-ADP-ribosyltransferase 5-like [Onychostoma macrolepis]